MSIQMELWWGIKMAKNVIFSLMFFLLVSLAFGKPMESVDRYHVIRVHGASDSESGMD